MFPQGWTGWTGWTVPWGGVAFAERRGELLGGGTRCAVVKGRTFLPSPFPLSLVPAVFRPLGHPAKAPAGNVREIGPIRGIDAFLQQLVIPDLWQQQAVRALREGKDVVVHAPTRAGKTFVFELLYPSLRGQSIFTVPTRALANDKLAEWRAKGWDVGLSTGDLCVNLNAKVVVATLETQKGKFLSRRGPALR